MPWPSLHRIPGLAALVPQWEILAGPQFPALRKLCLQPANWTVPAFACPRDCGCRHYVILRHDRAGAVAACRCEPPACPDFELSMADITPLEVSKPALAAAIRSAFGLSGHYADLRLPETFQVGAWSADLVPVILTIQFDSRTFRSVIAELGSSLRRPYILLAPTAGHMDANCQALLARDSAGFFPLDTTTVLTDDGRLLPAKSPGELFARFNPEPKDAVSDNAAIQAFALVKALDNECPVRKAPIITVFRLYCMDGLSAQKIAHRCHCTTGLVFMRLRAIRAKLGRDPAELRQLATNFHAIDRSLSDPRARRINPKATI